MYIYTFEFRLARHNSPQNIEYFSNEIAEACDEVNAGITFKRHGKRLVPIKYIMDGKKLLLELHSRDALANPSRSLTAISRYLCLHYQELFTPLTYNHTLFESVLISKEEQEPITPSDSSMSDPALLKGLIYLLFEYTSSNKADTIARKEAIQQIKNIVSNFINDFE